MHSLASKKSRVTPLVLVVEVQCPSRPEPQVDNFDWSHASRPLPAHESAQAPHAVLKGPQACGWGLKREATVRHPSRSRAQAMWICSPHGSPRPFKGRKLAWKIDRSRTTQICAGAKSPHARFSKILPCATSCPPSDIRVTPNQGIIPMKDITPPSEPGKYLNSSLDCDSHCQ